jgi:hypothetical protein
VFGKGFRAYSDQKFIRQHYVALKEGKDIGWSVHHDLHCFDSLRQSIMCMADDNLLYATGHKDAGYLIILYGIIKY